MNLSEGRFRRGAPVVAGPARAPAIPRDRFVFELVGHLVKPRGRNQSGARHVLAGERDQRPAGQANTGNEFAFMFERADLLPVAVDAWDPKGAVPGKHAAAQRSGGSVVTRECLRQVFGRKIDHLERKRWQVGPVAKPGDQREAALRLSRAVHRETHN